MTQRVLIVMIFLLWMSPAIAERTLSSDPVNNLNARIMETILLRNLDGLTVDRITLARGTQSYSWNGKTWKGTGPLAALYTLDSSLQPSTDKTGTHYMHLKTPAWEFTDGRLIAKAKKAFDGASKSDIAWLDVKLKDNILGIRRILRIETRAGTPPLQAGDYLNQLRGMSYETYYVFLK